MTSGNDFTLWRLPPDFGAFLRERRIAANLSLEDAGDVIGTNPSYLSRLERNEPVTPPTTDLLVRIAEAYFLAVADVATAAGIEIQVPPEHALTNDPDLPVHFRRLIEHFRPFRLEYPGPGSYYYSPMHKLWAIDLARRVEHRALSHPSSALFRDALMAGTVGRRSPEEVDQLRDAEAGMMAWRGDPGFGERLRAFRTQASLTLREAAQIYGVSHARISQLESSTWRTPPTLSLMKRVAQTYGKKLWEVMEAAGFRSGVPPDVQLGVDTHELFRRMILDLGLRPAYFEDRDFALLSPLQKQQLLDLAEQVDRLVRERGPCIERILSEDPTQPASPG